MLITVLSTGSGSALPPSLSVRADRRKRHGQHAKPDQPGEPDVDDESGGGGWDRHPQGSTCGGGDRHRRDGVGHAQLLHHPRRLPGPGAVDARPSGRWPGSGWRAPAATAPGSAGTWPMPASRCWRSTGRTGRTAAARGKDDDLDAISAARAALHGRRVSIPKSKDGAVESLRVLRVTRQTAIRARRNALQLLRMTIVAAPEELRDQVRNLTRMQLIRTCAAWRPETTNCRRPGRGHPDRVEEPGPPDPRARRRDRRPRRTHQAVGHRARPRSCWTGSGSGSRSPASCWSPPATTPTGSAPRPASPCCAVSHRCPHRRG